MALEIVLLKRLKSILLCSVILFTICFVVIQIQNGWDVPKEETNYAKIVDYEITGDTLKLELKGNQNYIAYYQISSKEEKEWLEEHIEFEMFLTFQGEFQQPSANTNFYQFSYRNYLKSQNIHWQIQISSIQSLERNSSFLSFVKNSIQHRIKEIDPNDTYLNLFLLGSKKNYDDELYHQMGVSHLFCISGMHFSFFLSLFFSIVKDRKKATILSFPFLLFYAWMIGFSMSVVRVLGAILFSITPLKKYITNHEFYLLFFCILLLLNPFRIYDIGFLYSFVVSDALILFSKKFTKKNVVVRLIYMSWISFVASIPITLSSQYELQFTSILWNIIYIPWVSHVLFPLSFLTVCFPILFPLFSFALTVLETGNQIVNRLLPDAIIFCKPNLWFYLLFAYLFYRKGTLRWKWISVISLLCLLKITTLFYPSELVYFDVGQGDSILLRDEKVILIDTGGKLQYAKEEWQKKETESYAERVIIPYLKATGITKIDYLILSHGDYDHIGEAINLVENFKVEKVIFNCEEFNELEQELIEVLDKKKIPYYSCIKELNIDTNKLYFLNTKDYGNENDNSSVIYTELDNYKFLFMGDAGVEVEEDLIEKYNLNDIDVLKVGHHGSNTSSSKIFINNIKPKYAIISVGKNNRYGHPKSSVLDTLSNSKIYRTDLDGSIMFKIKNNKLEIETCAP